MSRKTILLLSGGIGGAKLALGLARVLPPEQLAVVANTGDDFEHLGLYISPDMDTLLYTLAGVDNPETGWGRLDETWTCMTELEALGGETWFRLGDRDLATHLYRTARLKSGARLSQIADELRRRFQVGPEIIPMCDEPVRTEVDTDAGLMSFQHYFVRERCLPVIKNVRYAGADRATLSERFRLLLSNGELRAIVISPSNPYLSIDPILAVPGVRRMIAEAGAPVVAVSPIVDGQALKGPAGKIMAELGLPVSARSVAEHYAGLIHGFVLDHKDERLRQAVGELGIRPLATNTVMRTLDDRIQVARDVLAFSDQLR